MTEKGRTVVVAGRDKAGPSLVVRDYRRIGKYIS
jgi:hypothetical protein